MKVRNTKILFSVLIFSCLSTGVLAATSNNILGNRKSNEPIEITSDSLEILQEQNKAIFSGRVIALQGDVRLKSDKMTVFYKSNGSAKTANKLEGKKDIAATSAIGEQNSIDKIHVEKNVFLATSQETASGAHGIYDVANQKIYLNDNVVLTRDKNVLKGDKLVYDFATGKSVLNSAAETGKPNQRVKALFVNEKEDKK